MVRRDSRKGVGACCAIRLKRHGYAGLAASRPLAGGGSTSEPTARGIGDLRPRIFPHIRSAGPIRKSPMRLIDHVLSTISPAHWVAPQLLSGKSGGSIQSRAPAVPPGECLDPLI